MSLYPSMTAAQRALGQVTEIRVVLGDQLNARHSWWQEQGDVLYIMQEVHEEATYVRHHRQKILATFAAMRNFAEAIGQRHEIVYLRLDETDNNQSLTQNAAELAQRLKARQVTYQEPDEYRLEQAFQTWAKHSSIPVQSVGSEHFLTDRYGLQDYFPAGKATRMEDFYRQIRRQTGILMNGKQPKGERWNYDQENRHRLPKDHSVPAPKMFSNDVSDLAKLLDQAAIPTLGQCAGNRLIWPVNRQQSRKLLEHFVSECLPQFGTYQDALTQRYWSLYHARLSFSLNSKMLSPMEVVQAALQAHEQRPDEIGLAQIEGFIRQIIGWREYIRLIYWHHMPAYASHNELNHQGPLPEFYWTGQTNMACLAHTIQQSLDYAYAHHIQRLMVTGNFALLAGVHPDAVDQWYLGIYIDAIEWVELPNTRGMSQYADGGLLATKPYASSGNYLKKMGDYCPQCYYQVSQRTGARACPFNSLYWHFIDRHQERLGNNHRMRMIIRQWQKKPDSERQALLDQASYYLQNLDQL